MWPDVSDWYADNSRQQGSLQDIGATRYYNSNGHVCKVRAEDIIALTAGFHTRNLLKPFRRCTGHVM